MTAKDKQGYFKEYQLDDIKAEVTSTIKQKGIGRPSKNPYDKDRKTTFRIPLAVHKALRHAVIDLDMPADAIGTEALIEYLTKRGMYNEPE